MLWKSKYAPNFHTKKLVWLSSSTQGLEIWNLAWNKRGIMQKHYSRKLEMERRPYFGMMRGTNKLSYAGRNGIPSN